MEYATESWPVLPDMSHILDALEPIPAMTNPINDATFNIESSLSVKNIFNAIKEAVQAFEETLDDEHEVGMKLTSFGQSVIMQVQEISYESPAVLIFSGTVDGNRSSLIQHMSQFNFLLLALPRESDEAPKRKIGFITED